MSSLMMAFIGTCTLGLINTIYLSYCEIMKRPVWCLFFPDDWCKKVQYSSYSKTFGIPNPFLGLGMLTFIQVLVYLHLQFMMPFWIIFLVVSGGFLFSLYFTCIQVFVLKALCTWCIVSALIFTVLFVLSLYITG